MHSDNLLGALRTLFGIFSTCREHLPPEVISVCFRQVLLRSLEANEQKYLASKSSHETASQATWNETANVLVEGVCQILALWTETRRDRFKLTAMLEQLLACLNGYLARHNLDVSRTVFSGLNRILSTESEISPALDDGTVSKAQRIWHDNNPAEHTGRDGKSDNQDTLIAYLEYLGTLLAITQNRLKPQHIRYMLSQLEICIEKSTISAYTSDVDQMTPLQKLVIDLLKQIPTRDWEAASALLDFITAMVKIAYKQHGSRRGSQTYLALSKSSMALLEAFVVHHLHHSDINQTNMVTQSLQSLKEPIALKYHGRPEGKQQSSSWRQATSVAINILEAYRAHMKADTGIAHMLNDALCEAIVEVLDRILAADCAACDDVLMIEQDQEMDVDAFQRIRKLVIPGLGSSTISPRVREQYVSSVFQWSLVHEPHPDDLVQNGQNLLDGLAKDHMGRVQDLPPTLRSRLSYLLLDELCDLVTTSTASSEHERLSQAARPYLTLRIGLTLKAYICDQPLRGLMPQPWSQRRETLIILEKLMSTSKSTRIAIPGVRSATTLHEELSSLMYPILLRALKAATYDAEVAHVLQKSLRVIGNSYVF